MNKTFLLRLACVCLATSLFGCGTPSKTAAGADFAVLTNIFSVDSLYGILKALPVNAGEQRSIGAATPRDYFSELALHCSDEPLVLNGKKFAGVAKRLKASEAVIRSVSAQYPSLNAMFTDLGYHSATSWSQADASSLAGSLEQTAAALGLASNNTGDVTAPKVPGSAWANLHALDLLRAVKQATAKGQTGLELKSKSDDEDYWDGVFPPAPIADKPRGQLPKGAKPVSPYSGPGPQSRPAIEGAGIRFLPYS